jgi:hypothetical protein
VEWEGIGGCCAGATCSGADGDADIGAGSECAADMGGGRGSEAWRSGAIWDCKGGEMVAGLRLASNSCMGWGAGVAPTSMPRESWLGAPRATGGVGACEMMDSDREADISVPPQTCCAACERE